MNIKDLLAHTASLTEIEQIAQNAEAKISFLGTKYVSFTDPRYEGTLHIDDLAARVIQLAKERGFDFTQEERVIGRKISQRISKIYKDSDTELERKNCISRVFVKLRNLFNLILGNGVFEGNNIGASAVCIWDKSYYSNTRWNWVAKSCNQWDADTYDSIFNFYTKDKFKEEFNIDIDQNWNSGYYLSHRNKIPQSFQFPDLEYSQLNLYCPNPR